MGTFSEINLGICLRRFMKAKGLNQKQLAQLSGVTESAVCRYLQGNRRFNMATCVKLANGLGVSIEALIGCDIMRVPYNQLESEIVASKADLSLEERSKLAILLLS